MTDAVDQLVEQPDFAAKVRWRMRHDRNPLFPIIQDKAAVKRYASERGVASPRVIHLTSDPATLPFDALPDSCFIKANHGWGWNVLCEAGELYFFRHGNELLNPDGTLVEESARARFRLSRSDLVDLCWQMLRARHGSGEWAYQLIPPQILVEEKLHSALGGELRDYRFYTFDGVVKAINVGSATYRKHRQNVFLDCQWQPIPLTRYKERLPEPLPPRPPRLEQMIAAAERLGDGLDFVRIDLYDSTQGVMLGEMTLYPDAGQADTPTACPRFNAWLGDAWQLPGHPAPLPL